MNNTISKGYSIELKCISAFIELGYDCSIPYGNVARYDFIVDDGKKLYKIQCKISRWVNDRQESFIFSCVNNRLNSKGKVIKFYDKNQIDFFATFMNNQVYIIPVEECHSAKTIRISESKIKYSTCNFTDDYKIENFFPSKINTNLNKLKNKKEYFCTECGTPVSKEDVLCPTCANLESRKVERPSREELKDLIRTISFWQIGKNFGVSDVMIHKWCKQYGLPYRKRDIKKINEEDWKNM